METDTFVSRLSAVTCYFDGSCEPTNPGGTTTGGVVVATHPDVPALACGVTTNYIYDQGGAEATNNVAEYKAALDALRVVYRSGWRGPVVLRGDSQLVIHQFNGTWQCHAAHLLPYLAALHKAARFFEAVTAEWIPRTRNAAADAAARTAYERSLALPAPVATQPAEVNPVVESPPASAVSEVSGPDTALSEERRAEMFRDLWSILDEVATLQAGGFAAGALAVPDDVVAYLWQVRNTGTQDDLSEALRLTSADGKGRDTYVACLLHSHKTLCDRLERAGVEGVLYYRAPMRLLRWHMATGRPFGTVFGAASAEAARALASGREDAVAA